MMQPIFVLSLLVLLAVSVRRTAAEWDAARGSSNLSAALAEAFCRRVKSTPEPRLLIYNRVPKCGSQTMTNILIQVQRNDPSIDKSTRWRQFWWPGDLDTNATLAEEFAVNVKKRLRMKQRVRIAGHWYWHAFDAKRDFGLRNDDVEYMNVLRDCSSRLKSQLLFDLFDTKEAKQAHESGEVKKLHQRILYGESSVKQCIENISCLGHVFQRRVQEDNSKKLTGMMVEFLSGTASKREKGSFLNGALSHLSAVTAEGKRKDGYTVLGLLEHYEESLELLECVYPTFFRNALEIYRKRKTHKHRSSVVHDSVLYSHPNFNRVLQPICDVSDNVVYKEAAKQFWEKLAFMRTNKDKCCR